jgi:Tfp pilus assembly protein PilF
MGKIRTWLLVLASGGLLVACAPLQSVKDAIHGKGASSLSAGISGYEDGKYPDAAKDLQNALEQGLDTSEQITAHKYLAFIQCISGKERLCRDEFKKALELNPSMELDPAEAGHPIWGPVFRSAKGKKSDAKK